MPYPMIDEDTLQMSSPFGAITSTIDKALKTYLGFKQANRKAETDIAKSLLEGMLRRGDMQMRTDLPEGMRFDDPRQISSMFETKPQEEKPLTPSEQISRETFSEEYGHYPGEKGTMLPGTGGIKGQKRQEEKDKFVMEMNKATEEQGLEFKDLPAIDNYFKKQGKDINKYEMDMTFSPGGGIKLKKISPAKSAMSAMTTVPKGFEITGYSATGQPLIKKIGSQKKELSKTTLMSQAYNEAKDEADLQYAIGGFVSPKNKLAYQTLINKRKKEILQEKLNEGNGNWPDLQAQLADPVRNRILELKKQGVDSKKIQVDLQSAGFDISKYKDLF